MPNMFKLLSFVLVLLVLFSGCYWESSQEYEITVSSKTLAGGTIETENETQIISVEGKKTFVVENAEVTDFSFSIGKVFDDGNRLTVKITKVTEKGMVGYTGDQRKKDAEVVFEESTTTDSSIQWSS